MIKTVKVPAEMENIFAEAEQRVGEFFARMERDPTRGIITIDGDRYILMRGEAIFLTLRDRMTADFGAAVAEAFLYNLAKTIGRGDAERFAQKMDLKDPLHRLSAGPVHFSHTGWAFVEILPESHPSADEDYFLVYNHPNTFESASYAKTLEKSRQPVCLFSAGYSAGWCSFSFGLELEAREVRCVACGDAHCRFVMAPARRLAERIAEYQDRHR
jgi:predicted hydrocarbon binding protein